MILMLSLAVQYLYLYVIIFMYMRSQMLQKLLASKNPDDLRAANRLIREMVRRDDKRMQKLQKRLDELELVQNNVKLLSELLSHYKPEAGEQERLLIDVSTEWVAREFPTPETNSPPPPPPLKISVVYLENTYTAGTWRESMHICTCKSIDAYNCMYKHAECRSWCV